MAETRVGDLPAAEPASSASALPVIFASDVVWRESRVHLREALFSSESAYLRRAVGERRAEFASVRACARRALGAVGVDRPPMTPGPAGAPLWPHGFVGSMTHTRGFYAAAVAPSGRVRSLGIDAEPNEPLPAGVHPLISDDEERSRRLSLTARRPEVAWDRLLFCAKESIYKAWHPVVGEWLGFEDVTVRLSEDGRFTARLIGPARHRERAEFLAGLDGWWWRNGGHLVAAAIAPAGT